MTTENQWKLEWSAHAQDRRIQQQDSSISFPPSIVSRQLPPETLTALPRPETRKLQYDGGNPQITIASLMIITATCAVAIVLVREAGLLAAHTTLAVAWIANVILVHRLEHRPAQFRFWNQFIWILLMPMVCIFSDPIVFASFYQGQLERLPSRGVAAYVMIGWQLLTIVSSWYVSPGNRTANLVLSGTLFAGSMFAFLVGVLLLPIAAIGTLFIGLGTPGLVPWVTAIVLLNTARMHFDRGSQSYSRASDRRIAVVAFLLPVAVSILAFWIANSIGFEYHNPVWDF